MGRCRARSRPAGRTWEDAGVTIVDDVAPFEQRKLWLLNGSHSLARVRRQRPRLPDDRRGRSATRPAASGSRQLWDEASPHLSLPPPTSPATGRRCSPLHQPAHPSSAGPDRRRRLDQARRPDRAGGAGRARARSDATRLRRGVGVVGAAPARGRGAGQGCGADRSPVPAPRAVTSRGRPGRAEPVDEAGRPRRVGPARPRLRRTVRDVGSGDDSGRPWWHSRRRMVESRGDRDERTDQSYGTEPGDPEPSPACRRGRGAAVLGAGDRVRRARALAGADLDAKRVCLVVPDGPGPVRCR